jgi:uncharacterized protein YlxP (DUF503 family)
MIIGLCTIEMRLSWTHSLKEKRMEIVSLISKVRSKYNVSISEISMQDNFKSAVIGFAAVTNERRHADSIVNEVVKFIEGNTDAEIISCESEII